MPLAPAVAAALTDHSAHPYSLFVGSLDVIKEAGSTGMGVSIDTVTVTEAGPGDVSSMRFTIDDPLKTVSLPNPVEVLFIENATGYVYFRGWTDRSQPRPDFGGQGRTIDVDCSGLEVLLDWMIVTPGYVPVPNLTMQQQIANLVQLFAPMLHAPSGPPFITDPNYTRNGSFAWPVGTMARGAIPVLPFRVQVGGLAVSGGTVRSTINDMIQDASWVENGTLFLSEIGVKVLITVDFYYNLRIWEDGVGLQPDDYTTLTISDTYAGPNRAAGLNAHVDWSGVIRSVYVAGFDAASSGSFSDGSGLPGQGALVNDTTITTAAGALSRAGGIMAASAPYKRGSFVLEDWSPPTTVHAGSLVSITDAATDVATTYRIREIVKTWDSGGTSQTWTITFGDLPRQSAAKELKRIIHPNRGRVA